MAEVMKASREKKLELIFTTAGGQKKTIAINQPKEDVTKAAAEAAMQKVIDAGVFTTAKGDLAGIVGARMRTTDLAPLA
ncbi:MAG: hypothetical protein ACFWT7_00040 [Succiniclasticum sp.]|jgi:hypothetical protein